MTDDYIQYKQSACLYGKFCVWLAIEFLLPRYRPSFALDQDPDRNLRCWRHLMPIPWPGDTSANVGLNFHNSSFKENPRCVWWSGRGVTRWLTCYSEAQYENCLDITFCLMSRQTHSVSVFKRDWMQHTPAGRGLLRKRPTHPCWRKTRSISHSAVYITTAQMVSLSLCNRAIR